MAILSPNYIDLDFSTLKAKLQEQLEESLLFNNYNYAGSNITVLIELIAYLGELTTYYLNKIAQNVFIDSATIYENVSRLAQLVGYYPKGYRASEGTIKLTILSNVPSNSVIKIDAWNECYTNPPTEEDAYISGTESIRFVVPAEVILSYPDDFTLNTDTGYYEYAGIKVKQGRGKTYTYSGSDLVDNRIYLPLLNFDHDQNLEDEYPALEVRVNDVLWSRVNDFYENVTNLSDLDKVYVFRFNKYKNYVVEFSDIRLVPASTDIIEIRLIETLGFSGNVGRSWVTKSENDFITVTTSGGSTYNLLIDDYNINNDDITTGGADPDGVDVIKEFAKSLALAQYRCVTKQDYKTYLNDHDYVAVSNAWGEQELNKGTNGDTRNYNKVYLSVVPTEPWNNRINYYTDVNGINVVTSYDPNYLQILSEYLEPRKMLCAFEEFIVPDFVYFKFTISTRIKSNYRFIEVKKDLRDKLAYYFRFENRDFGEMVSFNDLTSYLLDVSIISSDNNFSKVAGILNLNIRDISVYEKTTQIWADPYPAGSSNYPRYISYSDSGYWDENFLKVIEVGPHQFPTVSIIDCVFIEEIY